MCNLYRLKSDVRDYFETLTATGDPADILSIEKDYAAPGKPGYVVRQEDGKRVLSTMKWGFPTRRPRKRPAREGEMPFLYDWWTNARNMQSNIWKPWLLKAEHRCLVPFTRFAEPKAATDRQGPGDTNWWFTVEDKAMPCFGGLRKVDQEHDRVYAFCTTEPNPLVAPKHPKAMPVILLAEDHERWLTAPADQVMDLLAPYPSQLMRAE
ncbi:putative SOS response-associated peptidase YedK [Sphingomonas sp. SORGH_AS870]|uniref:SOS response-associated peptidase family protein n=1 Tax=Sphingomonas sp. SORGH_AS_0870 TaxID=3041801 RepID=UPI00285A000E|nr:SOS response-associated peptidase family protein [Sphingomonas sp. SORGH_AS_0870]MDR6147848.1 putative SOS response-associated peptidase YedK [Sphingomonas sp. SORGH_AS_0870]